MPSWSVAIALVAGGYLVSAQGPSSGPQSADAAGDLGRLLQAKGYVGVRLDRLGSGHRAVAARVAGREWRLLVDTGAEAVPAVALAGAVGRSGAGSAQRT